MQLKIIAASLILFSACSESSIEKKGFQVSEISEDESGERVVGLEIDSLKLETRPRNVLLTFHPEHRLMPIYKVNYNKKTGAPFTGSNSYHSRWDYNQMEGNNWNHNFMPGFEAVYGYNFVNVSHHNKNTQSSNRLFTKPVLIRTLYYPAYSKDTLNHLPVERDYYMVSVYNEDTNKDGFINVKDLRRFYHFDINGENRSTLIPEDYSVMYSEYDDPNDLMYVYAKHDSNKDGQMSAKEPIDIFWIDLKAPKNNGKLFEAIR